MNVVLLDAKAAAQRLGLAASTLAKWRVTGSGPRFLKVGRKVLYRDSDLTAWVEAQRCYVSTSEISAERDRSAAQEPGPSLTKAQEIASRRRARVADQGGTGRGGR
jgi:predicted DNA-binding transcriptional regulator AlpA